MVRTKADSSSTRVSASKAPRKVTSSGGGSSGASPCRSGSSKDKYSGGNPYNPQPIPNWQKGISAFFNKSESSQSKENEPITEESKGSPIKAGGPSTAKGSPIKAGGPSTAPENSKGSPLKESKESPLKAGGPSTSLAKNGIISDDED